jgi:hypothetical protein
MTPSHKHKVDAMTPMKFIKPHIDEFKKLIGSSFVERHHNKCDPSGYHDEWENVDYQKTGIKSDFIRLLKVKIKSGHSYSIGFAFSYLDKSLEESSVKLSIREGHQNTEAAVYLCSLEMPVIDFKDKLKKVNKVLESSADRLDYKTIIESLTHEFCQHLSNKNLARIDLSSPYLKRQVYSTEISSEI